MFIYSTIYGLNMSEENVKTSLNNAEKHLIYGVLVVLRELRDKYTSKIVDCNDSIDMILEALVDGVTERQRARFHTINEDVEGMKKLIENFDSNNTIDSMK